MCISIGSLCLVIIAVVVITIAVVVVVVLVCDTIYPLFAERIDQQHKVNVDTKGIRKLKIHILFYSITI